MEALWNKLPQWKKRDFVVQARAAIHDLEIMTQMGATEHDAPDQQFDLDILAELHNNWEGLSEESRQDLVAFLRELVFRETRGKKKCKAGGES